MRVRIELLALCACVGVAAGQPQRHDRVFAVPTAKAVTVDGDLAEWDRSMAIDCAFDESLRPRFSTSIAFMYDKAALYIAAHVADDTPLRNRHDPKVEPDKGWAGDCLQVRLCSDPKAPYPLADSNSDRIAHLDLWHYTDRNEPVLHLQYGMDYHGTKLWTGAESGVAFRKDADGKGYTLEARVPWARLNASDAPPKAGDRVALVVQPLWGDASGWKHVCTFNDVVRQAGFSFQGAAMWGQAIFSPRGNLPREERGGTVAEALAPLVAPVPVPDAQARSLSAAVYDADGRLVRSLPVTSLDGSTAARSVPVKWDGLDDDGRPLPPADYTVKALSHRGIGQKWVTSLHSAGNPPWRTDDGTGAWGGDHGPPIAAASHGDRVYLGWTISEAGWAVVALKRALTPEGKVQKLWGQHQVLDLGIHVTAMATDGERLFVAQDGKRWGQRDPTSFTAGVVLWDAATGKPINFPFGKRTLVVSEWKAELKRERKPFWENVRSGDIGPQDLGLNLAGIAVDGDLLYASLHLEDRVVAFNWRTGKRESRSYSLPRPAGLVVEKDGNLLVVSGKRVVRQELPDRGATPVAYEGLSAPWAVATDREGHIYVTDCGKSMQVKMYDRTGKPFGVIGKPGGRPWVGRYDPTGLLKPSGITVDGDHKVWVCEHDNSPRRVSVWSPDGDLVADLLGPGAYAVEGLADLKKPSWVNVHSTLFDVDYATGSAKTLATLLRPNLRGLQFTLDGGNMGRALKIRHLRGRTYVVHTGRGAIVVYRLGEDLVAVPLTAMGDTGHMRFHLPQGLREELKLKPNQTIRWIDRNGNSFVETDEIDIEPIATTFRDYWGPWIGDDLTVWNHRGKGIYRVPVQEWLPNDVPVYPKTSEQKPLFKALGDQVHYVMPDGDSIYLLEQQGGNIQTGQGTRWSAISRYTLDGKRLWAYRRVWLGFGLEAPLSTPGDVVGAMKFIGSVKLADGLSLIGVNGYFGHFNLLSSTGLWVASLCKDNRYGPKADATTVWPENFSGFIFRNRENGKAYLIAGDTDARIWELTGLEHIRTAQATLRLSEADREKAIAATLRRQGADAELVPLRMPVLAKATVDGSLAEWDMTRAAAIEAGPQRGARVVLARDGKHLLVAFDVQDTSPMANSGKEAALLFKTGDACDVFLAANPEADPKRTRPVAGDVRVLLSVLDGKPVCVLYAPVRKAGDRAPRMLSSPVSAEAFDFVGVLDAAKVAVARSAKGYTLEAAIPLAALGFAPRPGLITKGDVGVVFSDPGGSRNVLRVCYANKETAIVNDIPSEARLTPEKWGVIRVE